MSLLPDGRHSHSPVQFQLPVDLRDAVDDLVKTYNEKETTCLPMKRSQMLIWLIKLGLKHQTIKST